MANVTNNHPSPILPILEDSERELQDISRGFKRVVRINAKKNKSTDTRVIFNKNLEEYLHHLSANHDLIFKVHSNTHSEEETYKRKFTELVSLLNETLSPDRIKQKGDDKTVTIPLERLKALDALAKMASTFIKDSMD